MKFPIFSPFIVSSLLVVGCVEFQIEDADQEVQEPTIIEEIFEQSPTPKVDVLWVVDNTGSMVQEQQMLADGMHRFVEALNHEDINWHAGIVTTDVSDEDVNIIADWIDQGARVCDDGYLYLPEVADGLQDEYFNINIQDQEYNPCFYENDE